MEKKKTIIVNADFYLCGEIAVNVPENFNSKNLDKIRKQLDKQDPDNSLSKLMVFDDFIEWESFKMHPMFRPDVIKLFKVNNILTINEELDCINEFFTF